MAKTQSTIEQLRTEAAKPLYAVAGATELAYEFARGYAVEAQKTATVRFAEVQNRISKIEREPKALQNQAIALVNDRVEDLQKDAKDAQSKFEARIAELQKDAKDAQNKFEARVAELQKDAKAFPAKVQAQIDDTATELAKTYTELVDRGEKIVAAIRKDGVKAATAVRKAPNKSSVVRREKAKIAADKPKNSSRPVKKSATKKPVAKKTPAEATVKKASATKTAATEGAQSTAKSAETTVTEAATTASNTAAAATS